MRRRALALLLLPFLAAPAWSEDALDRAETQAFERIARTFTDLARALADRGMKTPAADAIARARALDPDAAPLEALAAEIDAIGEEAALDAAMERRIEKARSDAAKRYDRLARRYEDEDPERFATYLWRAVDLDPSRTRLARVGELAKEDGFLLRAPGHPFAAFLSVPDRWQPGKEYDVLVATDGAGCNFKGILGSYTRRRDDRPFIVLSPHALSCTNTLDPSKYPAYDQETLTANDQERIDFDISGLLGLLDLVERVFGGRHEVAITGFSGGGNLCYGFTLRHPDRVRIAVPACANFHPGLARGVDRVEGGGPPVRIFTGADDEYRDLTHGKPPGIETQTDWAVKALDETGFTDVERTMVPGVGHSSMPDRVWETVDRIVR